MTQLLPFGWGAWTFISLYILSLLLFGAAGYRARKANTLHDFYVAGSGFGLLVMILTLYATQYSGNSFFGFTGKTYRIGFAWIMSVHFMTAIVVFYLLFAVRLHRLALKHAYVTPVDYVAGRFQSPALNLIVAVVMVVALSNYLLAQLMAMGRAMQGLAGPHGKEAYNYGVILLALVMVVYGTLGGMRAVAWTDMVQGTVLLVGFLLLLAVLVQRFGPLSQATDALIVSEAAYKVTPPDAARIREWFSYVLVVGMGGALYPQAIQRIYAARNEQVLRRSFAVMAFLPFMTVLIAVITGIYGAAYVPGLEGAASDQMLTRLFRSVQEDSVVGYGLVVVLFAAALSAIMSTADSALLSISSMLTKDIYAGFVRREAGEAELTQFGKRFSWLLIILLVALAIMLQEKASLIALLDRKFDILVQLVPVFMLAIRWHGLRRQPALAGLIAGLAIAIGLNVLPLDLVERGKLWNVHPGIYGLIVNFAVAIIGSVVAARRERRS